MEQFLHSFVSFPAAETGIKHSSRVGATLNDSLLFRDTSVQLADRVNVPGAFAIHQLLRGLLRLLLKHFSVCVKPCARKGPHVETDLWYGDFGSYLFVENWIYRSDGRFWPVGLCCAVVRRQVGEPKTGEHAQ
jgi:hypothetical protein